MNPKCVDCGKGSPSREALDSWTLTRKGGVLCSDCRARYLKKQAR